MFFAGRNFSFYLVFDRRHLSTWRPKCSSVYMPTWTAGTAYFKKNEQTAILVNNTANIIIISSICSGII